MNPQIGPDEDPSIWARPESPRFATHPDTPAEPPTASIRSAYGEPQADRWYEPPAQPAQPDISPTAPDYSVAPPLQDIAAPMKTKRGFLHIPLSIIVILVIVVALLGVGLIGAEYYARKRASNVVAAAAECEVKDKVEVSFGVGPSPFLLQRFTGHYTDISIHTAGNQIRGAKGMQADITVNNVTLGDNANSKGTIGAVDATITWTSDGIKETVQDGVPFGNLLITSVETNPGAGTIQLSGALGLGSVTLKPRIAGGGLSLEVVELTAMRAAMPHKTAQHALDAVTSELGENYLLGVRADSVHVISDGVVAHFSARNASIPTHVDPCFAHI